MNIDGILDGDLQKNLDINGRKEPLNISSLRFCCLKEPWAQIRNELHTHDCSLLSLNFLADFFQIPSLWSHRIKRCLETCWRRLDALVFRLITTVDTRLDNHSIFSHVVFRLIKKKNQTVQNHFDTPFFGQGWVSSQLPSLQEGGSRLH